MATVEEKAHNGHGVQQTGHSFQPGRLSSWGEEMTPIYPTAFERLMVKYPCVCCLSWLGFALALSCLAGMLLASKSLNFDQRGVWDVRSHTYQKQFDAFTEARGANEISDVALSTYSTRSQAAFPLHVLYYSDDGSENLLTTSKLDWMKGIEAKLFSATEFQSKCVLQYGVDAEQATMQFTGLDVNTNTATADNPPEDGAVVIFSGQSSVLQNGGLYRVRRSGNSFRLMVRSINSTEVAVVFSSESSILSGAQFFPTKTACGAADTVLNFAYPAPATQKQSMCNGFVPSQTVADVAVLMKLCGCSPSSVVNDASSQCKIDCSNSFAKKFACTSTAYVSPGVESSQEVVSGNLKKLCPDPSGLTSSEEYMYQTTRQNMFKRDWPCNPTGPSETADMVRSTFWIGAPLEGYQNVAGDALKDQFNDLMDWAKNSFWKETLDIRNDANDESEGKARVVIMGPFMLRMYFDQLMRNDGLLAIGSIWFVWMWTWCSTGSLLLASGCILECFISLPMSMATWGVFQQKWLGFLCTMMIFVILGIGADDVFVLVDAWKQSGQQGFGDDLQMRFCWAYRRARDAMLVTTMTTCFGFFAAGLSEVPSISGFGYFAALVVFWDYILCITLFASMVVLYHKYFEQKNACCGGRCSAHMGCCPLPCLGLNDEKACWKKPRIMLPFATLILLGIVAAIAVRPLFGCLLISAGLIWINAIMGAQTDSADSRPVEKFFQQQYFPFAVRHKIKSLVFVLILFVAGSVAVGTLLRYPSREEPFLSEKNPVQKYLDSSGDFGNSGSNPQTWVYVVFGIDKSNPFDRSGVDFQQPGTGWGGEQPDEPLGKVQYSNAAHDEIVSAAGQKEIGALCDKLRETPAVAIYDTGCEWLVLNGVGYQRFLSESQRSSLLANKRLRRMTVADSTPYLEVQGNNESLSDVSNGFCSIGVYCFMYSVRDYLVSFCNPSFGLKNKWINEKGAAYSALCVDAKGNTITGGSQAFPAADFDAVVASEGFQLYRDIILRDDRKRNGMGYDEFQRKSMTNFVASQGKLKFAFIGINGTIPLGEFPYSEQRKLYDKYKDFFDTNLGTNTNAYFSAFVFNWMFITEALGTNTIQSMSLGILFCFIVATLMTWNVVVSLIVVSSVVITVVISVGIICVLGWKLGIIEAIVLIVIVGISVDYSMHIGHAFNHALDSTAECADKTRTQARQDKAYVAVSALGISLLSGVATSLGSAVFIWFAEISFFRKFGQFLMITLAISFLVTFVYLIPLLLLVGPVKGFGDLPVLSCCKRQIPKPNGNGTDKAASVDTNGKENGQQPGEDPAVTEVPLGKSRV